MLSNIYLEIGSAKDGIENRPIFFKIINPILKEGDLLAVTKLDRCSRNTLSFLQLKSQLSEKHVSTALAAIAEFETARRLERQLQGIEAAKKKINIKVEKRLSTRNSLMRLKNTII